MKNFILFGIHWKISFLEWGGGEGGGLQKTNIKGGKWLLKKGGWTVYWFRGRGVARKMGVVFLKGIDTTMLTVILSVFNWHEVSCIILSSSSGENELVFAIFSI